MRHKGNEHPNRCPDVKDSFGSEVQERMTSIVFGFLGGPDHPADLERRLGPQL